MCGATAGAGGGDDACDRDGRDAAGAVLGVVRGFGGAGCVDRTVGCAGGTTSGVGTAGVGVGTAGVGAADGTRGVSDTTVLAEGALTAVVVVDCIFVAVVDVTAAAAVGGTDVAGGAASAVDWFIIAVSNCMDSICF